MKRARALVAAALLAGCTAAPAPPPSVILILVDDLGWADLGVHGSPDVATPNIDSIARDGVRFTAGYVSAPQCSPSRAGLLTGRYQNRFGFEYNFPWNEGLPPSERTLADRLRAAGYTTGLIGKWHLGRMEPMQPQRRGFDEALWHPNGGIYQPNPDTGLLPGMLRGDTPAAVRGYSTDAFTDEAIAFVERHRGVPFFLFLSYPAPHVPMEAPPEYLERFAGVEDVHRRAFLAMMAALDEDVGRLLDALRRLELENDTLLIFLSDNGGATGEPRAAPDAPLEPGANASSNAPFRGQKRDLLEGGIRVPFFIRWPGRVPAGATYDEPVISLDVAATILAAAGAGPPEPPLDGVDLVPFLRGERDHPPHEALFWRFDFPPSGQNEPRRWAIRSGNWKLVRNANEPLALYDLAADPGETRDLASQHPERVEALRAAWARWNAELAQPAWRARGAADGALP